MQGSCRCAVFLFVVASNQISGQAPVCTDSGYNRGSSSLLDGSAGLVVMWNNGWNLVSGVCRVFGCLVWGWKRWHAERCQNQLSALCLSLPGIGIWLRSSAESAILQRHAGMLFHMHHLSHQFVSLACVILCIRTISYHHPSPDNHQESILRVVQTLARRLHRTRAHAAWHQDPCAIARRRQKPASRSEGWCSAFQGSCDWDWCKSWRLFFVARGSLNAAANHD